MPQGLIIKLLLGGQIQNKKTDDVKLKRKKTLKKETENQEYIEILNKNKPIKILFKPNG